MFRLGLRSSDVSTTNYIYNMKSITENKLISLFNRHYGNESMNLRLAKLIEEVNELKNALVMQHPEEDIKAEIADVYSVIMDIAARYNMYQTDIVAMTLKKHQERGRE